MILHAGNGLVLTQSADIPMRDRLFLPHVTLRDVSEVGNWKEVTIKQRDEMLASTSIVDVDNLDVASIKKLDTLVNIVAERINNVPMTVEESIELADYFPIWKEGEPMPIGRKVSFNGSLFEVLQEHTSQSDWNPKDAKSLYKVVQVTSNGTKADPVVWEQGMVLEEGKFYKDGEVIYLCIRDSGNPLYYSLDVLFGNYVDVVNE